MAGELEEALEKALESSGQKPRAVVRLPVLEDYDRNAWRDLVSAIGAIVHIHETLDEYVEEVAREAKKSPTVPLAGLCRRGARGKAIYKKPDYPTSPVSIPLNVGTMVLGVAAVVGVAKELDLYPAEAIAAFALDPDYADRVRRLVVRLPKPVEKADAEAPTDPDVDVPRPKHYWVPCQGAKRAKRAYRPERRL